MSEIKVTEEHQDKPEDWLLGVLLFTRALGIMIPEGRGIVIDLVGDMKLLLPRVNKVVIANHNNLITVKKVGEDESILKEGDWVELVAEPINK